MADPAGDNDQGFLADWRRWRAHREALLTAPYSPLSPIGMGWLDETPVRSTARRAGGRSRATR